MNRLDSETKAESTNCVGEAEAEADERVGERHDRGEDRQPRHVVEVRYEGEEQLRRAEHEHVVATPVFAGRVVAVRVVAVGPQDRPAKNTPKPEEKKSTEETETETETPRCKTHNASSITFLPAHRFLG